MVMLLLMELLPFLTSMMKSSLIEWRSVRTTASPSLSDSKLRVKSSFQMLSPARAGEASKCEESISIGPPDTIISSS